MSAQSSLALSPRAIIRASRAARLRLLAERARRLVWLNEEGGAKDFLIGPVAEGLDRIACELEQLAGLQQMYEHWDEG